MNSDCGYLCNRQFHLLAFAGLSALFAGLTAVLAKVGIENVPSNLATLVRTVVIVAFASGIVAARGELSQLREISARSSKYPHTSKRVGHRAEASTINRAPCSPPP